MFNKFPHKSVTANVELFQVLVPVLDCNYINVIKHHRTVHGGVGNSGYARWSSDAA